MYTRGSKLKSDRSRSVWLGRTISIAALLLASLGALLVPATRAAPAHASPVYPAEQPLAEYTSPRLAEPAYLTPATEPSFGTQLLRVADDGTLGSTQQYLRHYYSLNEPWNADESLLCLCYTNPAPLLDGHTYRFIRWMSLSSASDDILWSPRDANAMIVADSATRSLEELHPKTDPTDTRTVLHTFSQYDRGTLGLGPRKGNISNDGRWAVVTGSATTNGATNYGATLYDLQSNAEVSTHWFGTTQPSWVGVSPLGDYIVAHFGGSGTASDQGVWLYDASWNIIRQITADPQHADMGLDAAGREVYVTINGWSPNQYDVSLFALDGSYALGLLPKGSIQGHVSCRNVGRPGWCYLSDLDSTSSYSGYHEVFALKLDGSGTVELFTHDYATGNIEYEAEPQVVPNHDGSRVIFASDWQQGSSAPVYSYVAQEAASPPTTTPTGTPSITQTATATPAPTSTPTATPAAGGTPDFTLSASPSSLRSRSGGRAASTIRVAPSGGLSSAVTLSVTGLPRGASAVFSPNPATSANGYSSTMTVSVPRATPAGAYVLTVTGTAGLPPVTHQTAVTLTVTSH